MKDIWIVECLSDIYKKWVRSGNEHLSGTFETWEEANETMRRETEKYHPDVALPYRVSKLGHKPLTVAQKIQLLSEVEGCVSIHNGTATLYNGLTINLKKEEL